VQEGGKEGPRTKFFITCDATAAIDIDDDGGKIGKKRPE